MRHLEIRIRIPRLQQIETASHVIFGVSFAIITVFLLTYVLIRDSRTDRENLFEVFEYS